MNLAAAVLLGCFLPALPVARAQDAPLLTLEDVQTIMAHAVSRAKQIAPNSVVAVVDREGFVLGVWDVAGRLGAKGDPLVEGAFSVVGGAVREAGTASYLSSDQNAFTSRTAQFIIQQNFPPGINNQSPGPLVGVEFSNQPFSDVNRFKRLDPGPNGEVPGQPGSGFVADSLGTGIPNTRLSGRSSSGPLYKSGVLVGGIGVFTDLTDSFTDVATTELSNTTPGETKGEAVAVAGQVGYEPSSSITADKVTINGIRVPYVSSTADLSGAMPFASLPGNAVNGYSLHASPPPYPFPTQFLGNQNVEIRFPIMADPTPGTINGQARLTAAEVTQAMAQASARARVTRAGIRLPLGSAMQVWITVVGNPNANGVPAPILGIGRTPGATFFSFDVALQKARTALFFSSNTLAMSSRAVGFLAQNFYPPGLNGKGPGPFGPEVFKVDPTTGSPIADTVGQQVTKSFQFLPLTPPGVTPNANSTIFGVGPPNANLPNGITVFPGGFPLYRNGQLIGAVGISGDGVDQDDVAGSSATAGPLAAPPNIRSDEFTYDGARLPFAKYPRNPEL